MKLNGIEVHKAVTVEVVMDAVTRELCTLDNPGFCILCGEEAMDCEPDARNYECDYCGARQVFGAQELLLMMS